jgi:hypothetical protein
LDGIRICIGMDIGVGLLVGKVAFRRRLCSVDLSDLVERLWADCKMLAVVQSVLICIISLSRSEYFIMPCSNERCSNGQMRR